MTQRPLQNKLDSLQRLREVANDVHSCACASWVGAGTAEVLVGKGLRCRSRSRSLRCESQRSRAESSQPLPVWRASWERRRTIGLSVSGQTPALDKGWSQGSGRDSKTGQPLHKKTFESCIPESKGSRFFVVRISLVSDLPSSLRSYAVIARPLRRLSRQQCQVDGTCRGRGSLFYCAGVRA